MKGLSYDLLMQIFRSSPDAIVICERKGEEWILTAANEAFERLVGASVQDLQGRDLKPMRNKDGALFWDEFSTTPVKDAGGDPDNTAQQYIGFHRDVGARLRALESRPAAARESLGATGTYPSLFSVLRDDRVTGLYNRAYFDELMRRDWAIAQRDKRQITLFLFDIDCLGAYNDTFGRQAGDSCIKRVGRAIAGCLRRGSDLTARLEGGTIAALIQGMNANDALKHANGILERVREQRIHHPRSSVQKFVTVSAGFMSLVPSNEQKPEELLERVKQALKEAKATGRNRLVVAEL